MMMVVVAAVVIVVTVWTSMMMVSETATHWIHSGDSVPQEECWEAGCTMGWTKLQL